MGRGAAAGDRQVWGGGAAAGAVGSHLLGDRQPPVPYSSTPPTSGWHASGLTPIAVHPLSEPQQVSVLEAGAVVVTYHELPDGELSTLTEAVEERHEGGWP